jgi:hypothetical protein
MVRAKAIHSNSRAMTSVFPLRISANSPPCLEGHAQQPLVAPHPRRHVKQYDAARGSAALPALATLPAADDGGGEGASCH